jgi:hypothetical protein
VRDGLHGDHLLKRSLDGIVGAGQEEASGSHGRQAKILLVEKHRAREQVYSALVE